MNSRENLRILSSLSWDYENDRPHKIAYNSGVIGGLTLMGGLGALALWSTQTHFLTSEETGQQDSNEKKSVWAFKMVRQTLIDNFDIAWHYSSTGLKDLVRKIEQKEGVTKNHIIIIGDSTEGLKAIGLTYGLDGRELIAVNPTFQTILRYAENYGGLVHRFPFDENNGHDLEAITRRVTGRTNLFFICNPNNPPGTLIEKGKLRNICTAIDNKAMILSDEADYDYIAEPVTH